MKKFSELKRQKIRKFNEANLPDENYEEMSKEDLVKMLQGQKSEESKEAQAQSEEEAQSEPERRESTGGPSKLFSKLFESREMAHIYHLQVKGEMGSHAKHTALNDYYEGILGFVDEMIEVYQGQYEIIENYDIIDTSETTSKDTIEYFNELAQFIKVERKCISDEDTHIHNIIDEAVALVYKTLYKLKYNK